MNPSSSFFNWVIADHRGVPEFFDRYFCKPLTLKDLYVDRQAGDSCLKLSHSPIWLFHERPLTGDEYLTSDLERISAKYEHLRQQFFEMTSLDRRIFVFCNAQFNLSEQFMCSTSRGFSLTFSEWHLNKIYRAVNNAFPKGNNTLAVLMLSTRRSAVTWSYPTMLLEPDRSDWEGDTKQWAQAAEFLAQTCGKKRYPLVFPL